MRGGLVVLAGVAVALGRADDGRRAQAALEGGGCLASENGGGALEDCGEHVVCRVKDRRCDYPIC